jgi:hypothetical protein
MTVTVSDFYVPSCETCCLEIERITRAAIRDFSVTKLTFTPSHRHNHEVETKTKGGLTPPKESALPPSPLPSGELFIVGVADEMNGFDHTMGSEAS